LEEATFLHSKEREIERERETSKKELILVTKNHLFGVILVSSGLKVLLVVVETV
jgi:hypothetical protein